MSKTMLIVDDSKLSRMMIAKIITTHYPDWTIEEAGNAQEALEKSEQGAYDFVTLDNNMPGRTGLEVYPELRDLLPNAKIGMFSANVQHKVVAQAELQGLEFIAKPLSEEKVLSFIGG